MPRRHKLGNYETYAFEVSEVEFFYMFGLNPDKKSARAFWEFCHPRVKGRLVRPELKQITQASITLMGDRELDVELSSHGQSKYEPLAIGNVETRAGEFTASVSVPYSTLLMILPAIVSGQIKAIILSGEKLRYRRALITSIDFMLQFNPNDY